MRRALVLVVAVVLLLSLDSGAACASEPLLTVERQTLTSKVLGEQRVALVSLPAGYQTGNGRFSVLYLTDGDQHIAHLRTTVDFLATNGLMPQLIIVGITNTARTRDLTPTHVGDEQRGFGRGFQTSGGGDRFLSFIESELIPFVEKTYRTLPYRVFAGHSFGGLFGINALLTRPELFNAVIAVSPSVQWDDQLLLRRGREFFSRRRELNRSLYLTVGNEGADNAAAFEAFTDLLAGVKAEGFRWKARVMPDDDHGSLVLASHYDGLRAVFEGWRLPRDPETRRFGLGLAGLRAHYSELSKRFGYPIAPPEPLVNQLGYERLLAGDQDTAIELFRFNVELYPGSANVHDSLGEALEQAGRLEEAVASYERAATIGWQQSERNAEVFKRNHERAKAALAASAGRP